MAGAENEEETDIDRRLAVTLERVKHIQVGPRQTMSPGRPNILRVCPGQLTAWSSRK